MLKMMFLVQILDFAFFGDTFSCNVMLQEHAKASE